LSTLASALKFDFAEHQTNLTNSINRVNIGFYEQSTRLRIEHLIQETSKKFGETSFPGKTLEKAGIDELLLQTFLEVLSKVRQGYRQKRYPLVFNPTLDPFEIASGARTASGPQILEDHLYE